MNTTTFNRLLAIAGAVLFALLGAPLAGALVFGSTTDTRDLDSAMKIIFEDTLVSNAVTDSELLMEFEDGGGIKTDQTTGGRYIETAQLFNLPAGVGFRREGDYIPIPEGPVIRNSRINLKKVMASVEMTAETLKRVRTDVGAYLDWGERAFPTLLERLKNTMDHTMLGYGAGIRARVVGIDLGDPGDLPRIEVDRPFGIDGLGSTSDDALLQFLGGDQLRASDVAHGETLRDGTMIVRDIDFATGELIVNEVADGLVADDFLFGGDDTGDDSKGGELLENRQWMGLFGHVDNGDIVPTYQNIPRSQHSAWRSQVFDAQAAPFAAGQTLTEELITYVDDTAYTRGHAVADLIVTSRKGVRDIWKDLKGDRHMVDPRNYTGGKGKIFILLGDRQVQIKVARKMPSTVVFGLTKSTFKKYFLHNFEWDKQTGAIWRQVTDSTGRKDAFYAYGSAYCEFGGSDPQKNWRIDNLAAE